MTTSMKNGNGEPVKQTTVEEGTELQGTLRSTCPVVVRGVLNGQINAPSLTVAQSGTVTGDVKVQSIRSEGVLAGNVDAEDVFLSGSVRSDTVIRAKTLEVKLQREKGKLEVTFGECVLEVGDEPGAEAKVSESTATAKAHSIPPEAEPKKKGKDRDAASDDKGRGERLSVPPSA